MQTKKGFFFFAGKYIKSQHKNKAIFKKYLNKQNWITIRYDEKMANAWKNIMNETLDKKNPPLTGAQPSISDSCHGDFLSITSIRMVSRSDRLSLEAGDWCVIHQIPRLTIQLSGALSCFCLTVRLKGRQLAGNTNISATHLITLNCDDCSCGVQWLHLLLSAVSYCSLLWIRIQLLLKRQYSCSGRWTLLTMDNFIAFFCIAY